MPPDCGVSPVADRDNRRQQLSTSILDCFKLLGWQWSDKELVEGIKKIARAHDKYQSDTSRHTSIRLRRKICRSLGESQIVPATDEAFATLAKQLGAEIVAALPETKNEEHSHVLACLSHRLLRQEIDGLAASKEIFPVFFATPFEPMFTTLFHIVDKLQLITEECKNSSAYSSVLWILAEAAKDLVHIGQFPQWIREWDVETGGDKHSRYLQYRRTEESAQPERARLRKNFAKLAPELRVPIFREIATTKCMVNSTYRDIEDMADMFGNADFAPHYVDNFPYSPLRKEFRIIDTQEIIDLYRDEIEEAVILQQREHYWMSPPSVEGPDGWLLPPPAPIARLGHFLQKLQLMITIPPIPEGHTHYPMTLMNAQYNIAILRDWCPKLRSLDIEVWSRNKWPPNYVPALRAGQSASSGTTTIQKELAKLVSSMLKLDVQSKTISYNQYHEYGYVGDYVEGDPESEMTMESFVDILVRWEGLALSPRGVGTGLADVKGAISEKYEEDEPWFHDDD